MEREASRSVTWLTLCMILASLKNIGALQTCISKSARGSISLTKRTLSMATSRAISCIDDMSFPANTLDPFLFCVYHKDAYPAGDAKMRAPRKGNGADFNPNAPYRM